MPDDESSPARYEGVSRRSLAEQIHVASKDAKYFIRRDTPIGNGPEERGGRGDPARRVYEHRGHPRRPFHRGHHARHDHDS